MNIFYTHVDPKLCALDHCKIHTRKMIVEYAQLLSTTHHIIDGDNAAPGIYKQTHANHPCAVWVRQSSKHYKWLYALLEALCEIYESNTGKVHKTAEKLRILASPPAGLGNHPFVEPPQCMPEEFRFKHTIFAYKNYLNSKYSDWRSRQSPLKVEWYSDMPSWAN